MSPKSSPDPQAVADRPSACAVADALARAAAESCRQHERLARVMSLGFPEVELTGVAAVAEACDRHVGDLVAAFETHDGDRGYPTDDDRRAANALWMASREFVRRWAGTDLAARELKRHSAEKLAALHADFELQASAQLALRQAVAAYGKVRPDALA